ncbi:MAG: response regulator [Nitrospinae bacterium]|nr:response regulator [Nitrospinota bacterium]
MDNNGHDLRGMRILIVDDTPVNVDILRRILERKSLLTVMASDFRSALSIATGDPPDLILLDVMLPGADGFEVCSRLKANPLTRHIPVIFLSVHTDPAYIVKGFSADGVDYIAKPFKAKETLARVETHLRLKKALEEKERLLRKVAESEKIYRTIVETIPEIIFKLDPERNIVFANPAFKFLGYDPWELICQPISRFLAAEDPETLLSALATQGVGPLSTSNLEVKIKNNPDSVLADAFETTAFLVDSFGLWDVPDEWVLKKNIEKNFLGTLCIGKLARK